MSGNYEKQTKVEQICQNLSDNRIECGKLANKTMLKQKIIEWTSQQSLPYCVLFIENRISLWNLPGENNRKTNKIPVEMGQHTTGIMI